MVENKGLLTEEYKEAVYYAELGSPTKGKRVIDELVAKIKEVIEGAGLTPEEIVDLVWENAGEWNEAIASNFMKVAKAQLQAVKKAIDKEGV